MFSSCNQGASSEIAGPQHKLSLELVDSILVEELEPLVIDDYQESTDQFLMRGNKSRKPYLVGEMARFYMRLRC